MIDPNDEPKDPAEGGDTTPTEGGSEDTTPAGGAGDQTPQE